MALVEVCALWRLLVTFGTFTFDTQSYRSLIVGLKFNDISLVSISVNFQKERAHDPDPVSELKPSLFIDFQNSQGGGSPVQH